MRIKEYINDTIADFTSDITTIVARTHMKYQIVEHVVDAIESIAEKENATALLADFFDDADDIEVTYSTRYKENVRVRILVEFSLHPRLKDETLCIDSFAGKVLLLGGIEIPLSDDALREIGDWTNSGLLALKH